jgi:hypothetical protein
MKASQGRAELNAASKSRLTNNGEYCVDLA